MSESWARLVSRWTEAGIIDQATAGRIEAFEHARDGATERRWPIWLALAFGGLMLGAGMLLFVSAQWDALPPPAQFTLTIVLVASFHVAGAAMAGHSPNLSATLHTVGTVSLGAGIFLCGQIFNLNEHWPSGVMLWALGAAIAWALLGQWPQMALFAILAPAWLASEWSVINLEQSSSNSVIPATGLFLLALVYFTTVHANRADVRRRVLLWLGGLSLLPASISLVFATSARFMFGVPPAPLLGVAVRAIGWVLALGLPLIVALVVRRAAAWPITVAVIWLVALLNLHHIPGHIAPYAWWAIGAVAFAAWGVRDVRTERINMGSAMLAATILTFYFSQVMDKMGRSASLIGLGMLCLAGGWVLDRGRRRLVRETRGAGPS